MGVPISWDPASATTAHHFTVELSAWLLCDRFIATSPSDTPVIDIPDSAAVRHPRRLQFSPEASARPDSHRDFTYRELLAITWDLPTGGVVSAIKRQGPHGTALDSHCPQPIARGHNQWKLAVMPQRHVSAGHTGPCGIISRVWRGRLDVIPIT